MNPQIILTEIYYRSLEYPDAYRWILLGGGISASLITILSWCCGKDTSKVEHDLEMRTVHYDIDQLASEINKIKRNMEGLKVNYQQIVDFLKSDE